MFILSFNKHLLSPYYVLGFDTHKYESLTDHILIYIFDLKKVTLLTSIGLLNTVLIPALILPTFLNSYQSKKQFILDTA